MSEDSPTFHYETAVKPEVYSLPRTLPGECVSRTEVSPSFEELPKVETSKSDMSLGSDKSFALEETSVSEAFLEPREPSDLEFFMPEVEAKGRYSPDEYLSQEAAGPLLQEGCVPEEEEPQRIALELLPGLHDPFAEVEAKLARLSSAVVAAEVPLADVPKVPAQVADVTQAAGQKLSGQSSAGGTQVAGHRQMSNLRGPGPPLPPLQWLWLGGGSWAPVFRGPGREKLCLMLCKPVGEGGGRQEALPGGRPFC